MRQALSRLMHLFLSLCTGIFLLNVNRMTTAFCGVLFVISTAFSKQLMTENSSGLTVRQKVLLDFSILTLTQFLGYGIWKWTVTLLAGLVFSLCLVLEWKLHIFSKRWED